ncbi:MAG: putative DNA binding domain-containing protein [Anaerolineales bacterium]|nr:putative DNA binding domain-containing protein [Anaerolineales bacterium]
MFDIPSLISEGMGATLHWFPEDVSATRLATILVGMANTDGGLVILGVAPRGREIHGISRVEELQDRVFQSSLLADPPLVLPLPVLLPVQHTRVLLVQVPAGLPHVYSLDGRFWGREGAQTNPLSARRLRQLLVERGVVQFESRVPPDAGLVDLDLSQVNAYLQACNLAAETWEDVLLRRGCLIQVDGELRPTYAGLLLFGRFPQRWLPNATLLAARFAGESFTDQFIKQEISGSLVQQLRQAETFLRDQLRSVVRMLGLAHDEVLEYPFEAVRELLVNAVAHRDYNVQGDNIHLNIFSDRLEIQSPGVLPGPVNLSNLLQARFSRNAVITQVLSDLGYVERLGYGLDRVVEVLRQQHMRLPKFEEFAGTFRVTLFNDLPAGSKAAALFDLSAYAELGLNPRQQAALVFLARSKRITNREYQDLCPDVHAETLRRDLAALVELGLLIKVGDKRATYYILKHVPGEE